MVLDTTAAAPSDPGGSASAEPDGRTRHYGDFYGVTDPELVGEVVLIIGNCQAESLRIMLHGADVSAIRVPPVHELVASDLPHLDRWLARADVLISQPIRDGYHGMPLGTRELGSRTGGGRVLTVPVIRFAGLYPSHAIIRPPRDASIVPPIVEYHDLRLLAEAAGNPLPPLTVPTVHAVAEHSLAELRRRESAHSTVTASDLFATPEFEQMRTLNHPGNSVWSALAARVRERLGLREHPIDPGRPLLNGVHAPREQIVIDAWGSADEATDQWLVHGETVAADEVRRSHLDWYGENPDIVAAGLTRHAETLRLLAAG